MYGKTHEILSREFFCLSDIAPIREIYCSRMFSDLGYNTHTSQRESKPSESYVFIVRVA